MPIEMYTSNPVNLKSSGISLATAAPVLYHLEYAPDIPVESWTGDRGGKDLPSREGANAYESMKALWDASFGSGNSVRIAEPLAYDPDLRVFVQGPVSEEQTLADLFLSALDSGTPEALGYVE